MIELTVKPRVPKELTEATIKAKKNKDPWSSKAKDVIKFKDFLIDHMSSQTADCCSYCSLNSTSTSGVELDHFIPQNKSMRWVFHSQNLILSCHRCNSKIKGKYNPIRKSAKTYNKYSFKLFHPYLHRFEDHFKWSKGKIKLNSKSALGRYSIYFFQVNSDDRLLQRMLERLLERKSPKETKAQRQRLATVLKSIE